MLKASVKSKLLLVGPWLRSCLRCHSFWGAIDLYCESCWNHVFSMWESSSKVSFREEGSVCVTSLWQWQDQVYSGEIKKMIMALKAGGLIQAYDRLAQMLAIKHSQKQNEFCQRQFLFVPSPGRKFEKKDHALSLALALAKILKGTCLNCLERTSQEEMKTLGRMKRKATKFKWSEEVKQSSCKSMLYFKDQVYRWSEYRVVFIDDIVTSGATARAAKNLISSEGNMDVWCLFERPLKMGGQK